MDILSKLVIPQSAENLTLLRYILILASVLLLPYLAFLKGAALYSIIFNYAGRKKRTERYIRFSKNLIDMITFNKSVALALGIVPLITLLLAYSQLLHASQMKVEALIIVALVIFIPAILLVYSYRYTFTLDLLLGKGKTEEMKAQTGDSEAESGEVAAFRERNLRTQRKTGIWGVILLFVASYLVIASIQLSFDTVAWSENRSIFFLLFSLNVIVKFLFFVIASLTITSGALLYYLLVNHIADTDPEYYTFARRFSLISGMITVVLLPLFILIGLIMTPSNALSDAFFMLSLLILFILFALSHLYFRMLKQPAINYSGYVFYLIIVLFVFFIINDQVAFSYAIQKQEIILVSNYDRITAQAREKEGKGPVISGKEIFDGRCSACHRFDSKLVGPAYKDVLPKYEGHRDQLIAFISNPTKKNPAFPPMPNQGLKPKEVEAIAEYIMKTYKEK